MQSSFFEFQQKDFRDGWIREQEFQLFVQLFPVGSGIQIEGRSVHLQGNGDFAERSGGQSSYKKLSASAVASVFNVVVEVEKIFRVTAFAAVSEDRNGIGRSNRIPPDEFFLSVCGV